MKPKRSLAFLLSTPLAVVTLLLVSCCSNDTIEGQPAELPTADSISSTNLIERVENTVTNTSDNINAATNTVDKEQEPSVAQETPKASISKSNLDIKRISRAVAYSLPLYHLNQLPLDEHISTNAVNLFINSLDPARSYYLQSDIDLFSTQAKLLHKNLRKGDISFAIEAYEILLERIDNRSVYVEELLEKGFDVTKDESFKWDRQDASWPKTEAEQNELWRKRIKHEYISHLVSKQVYAEEATETNTVEIVTTDGTNTASTVDEEYDEKAEIANLTPEEFIQERYKQFNLTINSFDEEMILQRFLTSFSQVYDPHSDYMSPSSVEDFDINMKLSLVGIGALLRQEDGAAKIVRIIPGGPAEKDGRLKAGDKIIAVAQGDKEPVSILHWPLYKSVRLIRGEKDTKVVLSIIPAADRSGTRTKQIELMRDEVKLEEQAAKSEVKELKTEDGKMRRMGVITLPDFYADFKATSDLQKDARRASTDVRRLVDELIIEGIDGLVLDLRNNGGGSLLEAIEIAGLFITSGPIVQVKERTQTQVLPDGDPEMYYDGPMIVLVNRLSASASEILAAALQDYKRAIIVGDKQTHGKGTVQTLLPLGNRKGSLKMTTAGFYRINGGSTQLKGVTPDILIPSYLDVMDIGEDMLDHALPWDTIRQAMYRTRDDIPDVLPLLTEQSKDRIADNEEFQAYLTKRERLKKRYDTKTVSLSLEKRLAEAEAEKELDDIQNGTFLEAGEEEKEKDNDIILDETLNILSDLISFKKLADQKEMLTREASLTK